MSFGARGARRGGVYLVRSGCLRSRPSPPAPPAARRCRRTAALSLASAVSSGSTVAFESIDGPPPEVFRKLVANLNDEAGTRQIAVVSRDERRHLPGPRLCVGAGRARQDHLRLGLGRLRHRQAPGAAHLRRRAGRRRQAPRRLGGRRRAGASPHGPERHGPDRGLPQFVRAAAGRRAGADLRDAGLGPRRYARRAPASSGVFGSQDQPAASATPEAPADAAGPPQPPKAKKQPASRRRGARQRNRPRRLAPTDGRSAEPLAHATAGKSFGTTKPPVLHGIARRLVSPAAGP